MLDLAVWRYRKWYDDRMKNGGDDPKDTDHVDDDESEGETHNGKGKERKRRRLE